MCNRFILRSPRRQQEAAAVGAEGGRRCSRLHLRYQYSIRHPIIVAILAAAAAVVVVVAAAFISFFAR